MNLTLTISVLVFAFASSSACAEINYAESLDWMLNDCDIAFVGEITEVALKKGTDGKPYEQITAKPSHMYRGEIAESFTFAMRNYNGISVASRWQRNDMPMLFFIKTISGMSEPPDNLVDEKLLLRDDGNFFSCVTLGKSKFRWNMESAAITTKFEILNIPDEIISYVSKISIFPSDTLQKKETEVTFGSDAHMLLYSGSAVYLFVPANAVGKKSEKNTADK